MIGLKTVVANLANRINQPHYLEIELMKVFKAGIEHQKSLQSPSAPIEERSKEEKPEHEGGALNPDNPNYAHNFFMRNADIWTDEHDWVMSIERFKKVINDFIPQQTFEGKGEEEIKWLAIDAIPVYPQHSQLLENINWQTYIDLLRAEWIKGYKAAIHSHR